MTLQQRAEEIAATIKVLAPVGIDWVFIVWDGSGDAAQASNVPTEKLVEVLRQLRGDAADDDPDDGVPLHIAGGGDPRLVDDDGVIDDFDEDCGCDHCERIRERLTDEREIADALACCADEGDGDFGIGTQVERIEIVGGKPRWSHGQRGEIVDMTDQRIRVMWRKKDGSNDRRTWLARSALGQRWRLSDDAGGEG